jgi:hypothetical protein
MSITTVQTVNGGTGVTSVSLSATSANNLLVVWHGYDGTTAPIITDNLSSTYTLLYANKQASSHYSGTCLSFITNCPAGITSITNGVSILCVREYSTGGGGLFFNNDQDAQATTASGTSSVTTAFANTFTPTVNNALLVSCAAANSASNAPIISLTSSPSGFSLINSSPLRSGGSGLITAFDWVQTTATGTTASTTFGISPSGTSAMGMVMMCFYATNSPGGFR